VNSHLEGIPSLGAFTARRLSSGDLQTFGGKTNGAFDAEILRLGAVDKFLADFLQRRNLTASKGDSDLVIFL
jgi:hypothetical protein